MSTGKMSTTANDPIRFAIVGFGYIGRRHAETILNNPNAELVSICEIETEKNFEGLSDEIHLFNDLEQMMKESPEFDVLCVATPNGFHAEHALMGLAHQKHVIIEKPMALKKEDGEKIVLKSKQVAKEVFCVMQNRYSPPAEWLKKIVSDGVLGKIFMVDINCYWNRDSRYYLNSAWKGTGDLDGGTLFTQFSHFVDLMYWVFGDVKDLQARFKDFNHSELTDFEDSGIISFEFVNGGMGSLSYSSAIWDKNMESSITVIAEYGTIKIGGQYMNKVEYCHIKDYTMPELEASAPPNDYGTHQGSASNHHHFYNNVIGALKSNEAITTNALDGLKVVEIIESIYELNPYFKLKKNGN